MAYIFRSAILSCAFAGSALAQDLPAENELADRVVSALPSWWQVSDFRQIAKSDVGDAAQPRVQLRFEADTSPSALLFTEVDRLDPFVFITETRQADDSRVLYGVMDLTYSAGEWDGAIEIENPVDDLGVPRDMFSSPTLIMGDAESDAVIEDVHEQREAIKVAEFEQTLSELDAAHSNRLDELHTEQESEIAARRSAHSEALVELESELERELDDVRSQYARQRGALQEELNEEIAALEVELEAEIERLQSQLTASEQAQELEAAYLESVEARTAMADELRGAMETALAKRVALVESLPQEIYGGVRCRDEEGAVDESWQLAVRFDVVNPSGMSGLFGIDETNLRGTRGSSRGSSTLVIRGDDLSLPLDARLSFAEASAASHLPGSVDVTISDGGVFAGSEAATWDVDGSSADVTCDYELS